jgi:hypothetical protein
MASPEGLAGGRSPIREKAAILPIEFDEDGEIHPVMHWPGLGLVAEESVQLRATAC